MNDENNEEKKSEIRRKINQRNIWWTEYSLLISVVFLICMIFITWLSFQFKEIFNDINEIFEKIKHF